MFEGRGVAVGIDERQRTEGCKAVLARRPGVAVAARLGSACCPALQLRGYTVRCHVPGETWCCARKG